MNLPCVWNKNGLIDYMWYNFARSKYFLSVVKYNK